MIAALAFDHPAPVPVDRLAELVWADAAPATARQALHNHLSRLRRVVPELIETGPGGYRLASGVAVDLDDLDEVARSQQPPGAGAPDGSAPDGARSADRSSHLASLLEATAGRPFADLADDPEVDARRRAVERARALLEEAHLAALLAEGRDAVAAEAARAAVERDPGSERRWWLLAVALSRLGRRRDALACIDDVRRRLAARGLDLGAELQALERLVIAADPLVQSASLLDRPASPTPLGEPGADGPVGVSTVLDAARTWLREPPGGRALMIVGAAGAGKTTVGRALVGLAHELGLRVVASSCDPEPAVPLQPIVELLEAVAARSPAAVVGRPGAGVLGVLSNDLSALVGAPAGSVEPGELVATVAGALAELHEPTLLLVEDVHWAPLLTVGAIAAVVERSTPAGTRVVLTSRPEGDLARRTVASDEIELPAWTSEDIEAWLAPREPDRRRRATAARWLRGQTGGLPIFVRELTFGLLHEGRLGARAAGPFHPPTAVPLAISAVLAGKVDRCHPAAARALEVAAVLGATMPAAWLAAVPGVDRDGIDELCSSGMLRPTGEGDELAIEHELLRRAALDRLAPAAAAEVHHLALVALDALAAGGSPLTVSAAARARHAVGAAALDPRRAVAAAEAAAEVAVRAADHAEAGGWWLVAADLAAAARGGDDGAIVRFRTRAGQALLYAGDERAENLLFDAARRAEGDGDWEAAAAATVAICRLGPTSVAGRPHDEAVALSERILPRVANPELRAALAAAASMLHSLTGDHDRCRDLYEQAEASARAAGTDAALVEVLPFTYLALSAPADLDRREANAADLAAAASRADRIDGCWAALHLQFSNQLQRGDDALRSTAARLAELTPQVGERQRSWEDHYVRATVAQLDGDLERAERLMEASLEYVDTVAASRVMAVYGVHLLAIRQGQGRLTELIDSIGALADEQPEVGAWRAALALAAAQGGDRATALAAVDCVLGAEVRLEQDFTLTGALVALGEAVVDLADPDRASAVHALLAPWSGRWSWVGTCTLGPIDTTLAGLAHLVGDVVAGDRLAASATDACRRLGAPGYEQVARQRHRS